MIRIQWGAFGVNQCTRTHTHTQTHSRTRSFTRKRTHTQTHAHTRALHTLSVISFMRVLEVLKWGDFSACIFTGSSEFFTRFFLVFLVFSAFFSHCFSFSDYISFALFSEFLHTSPLPSLSLPLSTSASPSYTSIRTFVPLSSFGRPS